MSALTRLACTFAAALLPARGPAAGVPMPAIRANAPFQVLRPTENHTGLEMVPDALNHLAQHEGNIALLAVVGPYHSGKSFLLNALLGEMNAFAVGPHTSPETMGLWLCRTNLVAADGSEIWLLDTEGFFGPGISETYDAKLFTIASILSAHLVYNTVKVIDQQAVNNLEMLVRRAQLFRTRNSAEAGGGETPEFLSTRSLPPLTWVVEDFVQEMHAHDGATEWLKTYLKGGGVTGKGEEGSSIISELYSDVHVHTLFFPATVREELQDLSRLAPEDLTPEFKREVLSLKREIQTKIRARSMGGEATTGRTLERALRFMVQALQRGTFPDLPSLWRSWAAQVAEMSLNDAEAWFKSLVHAIHIADIPPPVREFSAAVEKARKRAFAFYHDLLRDFDVKPRNEDLTSRQEVHFQQALSFYHEKIRIWVSKEVNARKETVHGEIQKLELPMKPEDLEKRGSDLSRDIVDQLRKDLARFAQKGEPARLGSDVTMPQYPMDPPEQLASGIRGSLNQKVRENNQEIQQIFDRAVSAATHAVEESLRSRGEQKCGRADLQNLRNKTQENMRKAFETKLSRYSHWIFATDHYRTQRPTVQEQFNLRWSKFVAANERRLAKHFSDLTTQLNGKYGAARGSLSLPMHEEELEKEHSLIKGPVLAALREHSGNLVDTEIYKQTLDSLSQRIDAEFRHLAAKNVHLYKAHSDGATRCATEENRRLEMSCGMFCMFNNVPWIHKSTSRRHLMDCFAKSAESSQAARMSPSMRLRVFESWYDEDMARKADSVTWNFRIIIFTLALILVSYLCMKSSWVGTQQQYSWGPHYSGPQYYSQPWGVR